MKKLLISAFVLVQVVTLAGVSVNFASAAYTQCSDGFNNDPAQDSLIDSADPGCHIGGTLSGAYDPSINSEFNTTGGGSGFTQCSDGFNNDPAQDTAIDAQDLGCHVGDVLSGAYDPSDNSEFNTTGGGSSNPQCSNGIDDDGQQGADQSDPDCYSGAGGSYNPNDNTEFSSCITGGCNPPPPNTCPAISGLASNYSASVGVQFSADANAFDAEGDSFSFSLTQSPVGMTINSATGLITWTPNSSQAGQSFTVTVRTTDSRGASCQASFTISVQVPPNNPPVCPNIPPQNVMVGNITSFVVNPTDPDSDPLSITLLSIFPSGNQPQFNSTTRIFSWTPTASQAGPHTFNFAVSDGRGGNVQCAAQVNVLVPPPPVNHPPVCPQIAPRTVYPGQTVHVYFSASDPDGSSLNYTGSNLPAGAQIYSFPVVSPPSNDVLIWTPSASQVGVFTPVIRATDPQGLYCERNAHITVLAPVQNTNSNNATTNNNNINNTNNTTTNNNNVVNVNVTGGGGGGGSTTNSCNDGIDNDGDGRIDYNDPGCQQGGNEWYNSPTIYQCNDGFDNDGDGRIDGNDPGCSSSTDNSEIDTIGTYQCSDNFDNDGDGRVDMNDPDCTGYYDNSEFGGTTLAQCRDGIDNDFDGRIDYPNDAGCFSYDDPSESDGTGTGVPVITSLPPTTASEGQQYIYDVNAYDPESQPITYSLAISPSGMIINSVTGLITWTPDFSQGGISYFVSVRASDGYYAATQNYIIAVSDLNPTPPAPPPGPGPAPIPVAELRIFNVRLTNDATGNVLATFETTLPANGSVRFGTVSEAERFNNFTYPLNGQNQTVGVTLHQINLGVIPLNQTHYMRAFATVGSQGAVTAELAFVQLATGIVGPGQVGQVQGDQTLASAFATIGRWIMSPSFLLFLVIILLIALIVALTRRRSVMTTSGPIEIHS